MPALGELDLADAVVDGAGERAALVAEELALEERVREGGAVDGDEAAALALALEVDGARRELLAGARLAVDEHRGVVLRQHADGLEDLVHRLVAAHHVGERVAVGELAAEVVDLVEEAPLLEDLLGGEEDLLLLEGLGDVVAGALLDGLDRAFDAGVAGDHDDVEVGPAVADLARQADAVGARDLEVDDRERELVLAEQPQRLRGVAAEDTAYCCDVYSSSSWRQMKGSSSTMRMRVSITARPRSRAQGEEEHDALLAAVRSTARSARRRAGRRPSAPRPTPRRPPTSGTAADASLGSLRREPDLEPGRPPRTPCGDRPTPSALVGPTCITRCRTATSNARDRWPGSIMTGVACHSPPPLTVTGVPFSCARSWRQEPVRDLARPSCA